MPESYKESDVVDSFDPLIHLRPKRIWAIEAIKGAVRFPQSQIGASVYTLDKVMEESDWIDRLKNACRYVLDPSQIIQLAKGMDAMHAKYDIGIFTEAFRDRIKYLSLSQDCSKVVDVKRASSVWDYVVRPHLSRFLPLIGGGESSLIKRNLLELEGGPEEVRRLIGLLRLSFDHTSLSPLLNRYKSILSNRGVGDHILPLYDEIHAALRSIYESNWPVLKVLSPAEANALFDFLRDAPY